MKALYFFEVIIFLILITFSLQCIVKRKLSLFTLGTKRVTYLSRQVYCHPEPVFLGRVVFKRVALRTRIGPVRNFIVGLELLKAHIPRSLILPTVAERDNFDYRVQ